MPAIEPSPIEAISRQSKRQSREVYLRIQAAWRVNEDGKETAVVKVEEKRKGH